MLPLSRLSRLLHLFLNPFDLFLDHLLSLLVVCIAKVTKTIGSLTHESGPQRPWVFDRVNLVYPLLDDAYEFCAAERHKERNCGSSDVVKRVSVGHRSELQEAIEGRDRCKNGRADPGDSKQRAHVGMKDARSSVLPNV